ncbi:DUF7344 domain-containing protein [Haladaptatus sp. DFWS20]|uniref:DUF7344 domain-containing protein n=1 Tax=Haladaptatus sp. DFWS20 TaxID=3403467 RepID=UPI003EBA22A1
MTNNTEWTYDIIYLQQLLGSVDSDVLMSTPDEVFKLLANEQRRHLIFYLIEQETKIPLSQMAVELASRVNNRPVTDVTPTEQEQMRISLEHEHLPRLANYGLLSWSYGEDMIDPVTPLDDSDSFLP